VGKRQIFHHAAANQMFLDNPLQRLRARRVIPDTLGIDQRDGPSIADAQAVGARSIDPVEQAKLGQAPLQISPGLQAFLVRTALGFALVGAEKNVPLYACDIQLSGAFEDAFGIGHVGYWTSCSVIT
jgi:hypothetical protein